MEQEFDDDVTLRPGARRSTYVPPAVESDYMPRLPEPTLGFESTMASSTPEPVHTVAHASSGEPAAPVEPVAPQPPLVAPQRQSLTDVALTDLLSDHSGIPLDQRIVVLETQMRKRDIDVAAYAEFVDAVHSVGTQDAFEMYAKVRAEFRDIIASSEDAPTLTTAELNIQLQSKVLSGAQVEADQAVLSSIPSLGDDPHPWSLGLDHAVPDPEHHAKVGPSRLAAIAIGLGAIAAPLAVAGGAFLTGAVGEELFAGLGLLLALVVILPFSSRLSRLSASGTIPFETVVSWTFGTKIAPFATVVASAAALIGVVLLVRAGSAPYATAAVDSGLFTTEFGAWLPALAIATVLVVGTAAAVAPRRISRVVVVSLSGYAVTATLSMFVLGVLRLASEPQKATDVLAVLDLIPAAMGAAAVSLVMSTAFIGPSISALSHRNGEKGAITGLAIGSSLGLVTSVLLMLSLSMSPTLLAVSGNPALLFGNVWGTEIPIALSGLIVLSPLVLVVVLVVRSVAESRVAATTSTVSRRTIVVTAVAVTVIAAFLLVPEVTTHFRPRPWLDSAWTVAGVGIASMLGAIGVESFIRRRIPMRASNFRIMPIVGVVLGSVAGIALTSFAAFGDTSAIEVLAADLGYQIHALPSLAPVIALAISALVTVTAAATVRSHETAEGTVSPRSEAV